MIEIATREDVTKCRAAFWEKMRGNIDQKQLEQITAEINGNQMELPVVTEKEFVRIGG